MDASSRPEALRAAISINSEDDALLNQDVVMKLRADAANCRRMAKAASDPEAADALLQIADDIDVAISVFEGKGFSAVDQDVQQRR